MVARHFIAGRSQFRGLHHLNWSRVCDLSDLGSHPCERMGGHEMIGMCERAANKGQWTILTFHGIMEGHLGVNEVDFRELCDYLDKHKDRFWVAPVVEVARRVLDWRESPATDKGA